MPAHKTANDACNLSKGSRNAPTQVEINHIGQRMESFWEAEDLGCAPIRSCKSCLSCPECRYRSENLTSKEREAVDEMAASLQLTNGKPPIKIAYPLKDLANSQPSNHKQALAVQKAHERRIIQQGIQEEYNNEMNKMIDASNVVLLSRGEIDSWEGGVHYIVHFPVTKTSSVSTKVRIVSDSKLKNNLSHLSFNDLIKPVPNALSDMLGVVMRFREKPTVLLYDLSKAYQSIKTGLAERHLRRFFIAQTPPSL